MGSSSQNPMHCWTQGGTATQRHQVSACVSTHRCMEVHWKMRHAAHFASKTVPGALPSHRSRPDSGSLLSGAPGRPSFFLAGEGLRKLQAVLKLAPAWKGENVIVIVPKDQELLSDTVEPAPGAVCTSPVQTYLDLSIAGERGAEAADHLRQERLSWPK